MPIRSQKGFSVLPIILAVLVAGIISLTGFIVYSNHVKNNKTGVINNPCYTPPNEKITPTTEPSAKCLQQSANALDPINSKRPVISLDADGGNVDPCGHKIPSIGYAPATYQFTAKQDEGPAKVATYYFTFGDGTLASTPTGKISHTYANAGEYQVRLTAIDVKGIRTYGNTSEDLTVYAPGQLDHTSQMWKDRLQTDPNACQGT